MNIIKHINVWLMAIQNLRRFKSKTIAIVIPLIFTMAVCSFMMFTRGGFIKDAVTAKDLLSLFRKSSAQLILLINPT